MCLSWCSLGTLRGLSVGEIMFPSFVAGANKGNSATALVLSRDNDGLKGALKSVGWRAEAFVIS